MGTTGRYAYVRDSPTDAGDPLGLADFSDWESLDGITLDMRLTTFDISLDEKPPSDKVTAENIRDLLAIAARYPDKDTRALAKSILAGEPARKLLLEYVKVNLTPVKTPAKPYINPFLPCRTDRVMELISDLDSESFETRSKAAAELQKYDRSIVPFLREYVDEEKPSLELRQRLEQIAQRVEDRYAATGSQQAMLDVLEKIGPTDKDVRKILEEIGGGWSESEVTQRAQGMLRPKK
jgi:hypothetical protein